MSDSLTFVMKETLSYIWWKHHLQPLPQEHLVSSTVDSVRRAVYVESFLAAKEWESYLRKHFRKMAADQRSFMRFMLFACCLERKRIENVFDCYIRLLGMGAYFAIFCHARNKPYAVAVVPHVLEKFIKSEFSDVKVNEQFWQDIGRMVVRKGYLEHNLQAERMVREGCSKENILQAIARESTVSSLTQDGELVTKMSAEDIESNDMVEQLLVSMDQIVYQPSPGKNPPKKMSLEQKSIIASTLHDEVSKIPQKLLGFKRIFRQAENDLQRDKFQERRGLIVVFNTDDDPNRLILDCIHDIRPFLEPVKKAKQEESP